MFTITSTTIIIIIVIRFGSLVFPNGRGCGCERIFVTLCGLSSAPASQPRNAVLGRSKGAGAIGVAFTNISESIASTWIRRRAVGPAVAITTMVKWGIPHPPAGVHSVISSSRECGWEFYFFVSIVSVVTVTLINNVSEKRRYPTFWENTPSYLMTRITQMLTSNEKIKMIRITSSNRWLKESMKNARKEKKGSPHVAEKKSTTCW